MPPLFRRPSWQTVGEFSWLALLFLQPFNQFGAVRILLTVTVLACLTVDWRNTRYSLSSHRQIAPRIAAALALWAITVSVFGPYPLDSLQSLRKDFLVQGIILIAALSYVRSPADAWRMVGVTLAGFATVSVLSMAEIIVFWMRNGFTLWVDRDHSNFWGGYASSGSLIIPLLLGWLLAAPKRGASTVAGWALLCLAFFLIFLYGSRTPFPVIAGSALLLFILLKKWRGLLAIGLIGALLVIAMQTVPLGPFDKYRSLLKSETYVTNSGLSLRLSVWEGCWQIIADRPLTGYGHGWKKLAWAINDKGVAARWSSERPDIASYYLTDGKASYGKVNPHNYFLQVMFEIGAIGLLLAIAFWIAVVRDSARLLGNRKSAIRDLSACLIATLGAYALSNLTNGQWVGGLANLSLAFAGCLLAMARMEQSDVPDAQG